MKVYGYARVSTRDQDLALQEEEILRFVGYKKMELARIYSEKASGKNTDRPQFQSMIEDLRYNPLGVQAVVVYKLDRLGRSLKDLIAIVQYFKDHGIQFISIMDSIDTTTPQGVLFFHLMGSFAEYERNVIYERTTAGKERAQRQGVKFGRKAKELPMETILAYIADGRTKTWIANKYKIHVTSLYKHLKKYEAEQQAKEDAREASAEDRLKREKEAERIVSATY